MFYPEDTAEIVRRGTPEVAQRFPKPQIRLIEYEYIPRAIIANEINTVIVILTVLRTDVSSRIDEIGYNERRDDERQNGEYSF